MSIWRDLSIKFKLILGIILILVISIPTLSIVFIRQSERLLMEALEDKTNLLNRNFSIVSAYGIQESSFSNMQEMINEIAQNDNEIRLLVVAYPNGMVIATSDSEKYRQFSKIENEIILNQRKAMENKIRRNRNKKILESIHFIFSKSEYEESDSKTATGKNMIGFIYIVFDTTSLENSVSGLWLYSVLITLGLMSLGIAAAYWFGTSMSKPIKELAENVRVIASGDFTKSFQSERKDEIGQLITDMEQMRLDLIKLTDERAEKERLKTEMDLAAKIQTVLLPKHPEISGYEISASCDPAEDVGGDYYDIISVGGYDWIVIGDVSGHGVTAGLVMMMVQTSIHTVLNENPQTEPSRLLSIINKTIYSNIELMGESKHMTIIVLASGKDGRFSFSGSHEDILIRRARTGKVEVVGSEGMWIGLEPDISGYLSDDILKIEPGDCMVLFTDGITEAICEGDKLFGDERLIKVVEESGEKSAMEIRENIIYALEYCEKPDDVTLVVIKRVSP